MKAYVAFSKKEICEVVRTYKVFIMGCVFLLLGILGPITAKFMPNLLNAMVMDGMSITVIEPTAIDSWTQFFKNVTQMGIIVMVIVFSGTMSNEYSRGTLVNMLTKGLSRKIVILSKFTVISMVWTLSYMLCFVISYAYTTFFWGNDKYNNLFFSVFCLWLFGELLIAAIMLGCVIIKSNYGCLLFTGGFVLVLFIVNLIPKIQKFNPIVLASGNMELLKSQLTIADFISPIIIALIFILIFLNISIFIFNRIQV